MGKRSKKKRNRIRQRPERKEFAICPVCKLTIYGVSAKRTILQHRLSHTFSCNIPVIGSKNTEPQELQVEPVYPEGDHLYPEVEPPHQDVESQNPDMLLALNLNMMSPQVQFAPNCSNVQHGSESYVQYHQMQYADVQFQHQTPTPPTIIYHAGMVSQSEQEYVAYHTPHQPQYQHSPFESSSLLTSEHGTVTAPSHNNSTWNSHYSNAQSNGDGSVTPTIYGAYALSQNCEIDNRLMSSETSSSVLSVTEPDKYNVEVAIRGGMPNSIYVKEELARIGFPGTVVKKIGTGVFWLKTWKADDVVEDVRLKLRWSAQLLEYD